MSKFNDTAEVYEITAGHFDKNDGVTKVRTAPKCYTQQMKALESREYATEGSEEMYRVFFLENPEVSSQHWLKITSVALDKTIWARVLCPETNGNPSGTRRIYMAVCQSSTATGIPNVV